MNARLFFVGSDDVPTEAKIQATRDINQALEAGWQGLDIAEIVPLDQIARAHELIEHPAKPGSSDCGDCRCVSELTIVFPLLALPCAQARRAKVRNIGYGVRSDFELNFGRYLPSFGRADALTPDDG